MPNRPVDRTQSREGNYTNAQKNAEIVWVIGEYRKLYSAYRIAQNNLEVAEQNNRRTGLLQLTAIFNKAQFQFEYSIGLVMQGRREIVARDLGWVTPELEQLRHRAMGTF